MDDVTIYGYVIDEAWGETCLISVLAVVYPRCRGCRINLSNQLNDPLSPIYLSRPLIY